MRQSLGHQGTRWALGVVAVCLSLGSANAANGHLAGLTDQGYSGYINVPSAYATSEGVFQFGWSDALPGSYSGRFRRFAQADNYFFALGLFPRLEISARLISGGDEGFGSNTSSFAFDGFGVRDLSTNLKLTLWKYQGAGRGAVALGIQDLSGNGHFNANYAVGTYRWGKLEGSIGYGQQRMEGLFYGLRVDPHRFATVMYDDDTVHRTLAVEAHTGNLIHGLRGYARYRAYAEGPNAERGLSVGFDMDLGQTRRWQRAGSVGLSQADLDARRMRLAALQERGAKDCAVAWEKAAEKAGLERARATLGMTQGESGLLVAADARRFPQSPADAAGIAIALAASSCPGDYPIVVQIADDGAAKFWISANSAEVRRYLAGAVDVPPQTGFGLGAHEDYAGLRSRERMVGDVFLSPRQRYTVATEVGVLDYSLGVETSVHVPLWRGAAFVVEGVDDVVETDDFRRGGILNSAALESKLISRTLQQTVPLWGYGALRAHYGRSEAFEADRDLRIGELVLFPLPQTGLQIETRYSDYRLRSEDFSPFRAQPVARRTAWIGSARYVFGGLDALVELTWGQFHFEDEGARLRIERFFGDTGIALQYLRDKSKDNEALAVSLSLPFGARQTVELGPIALGGSPSWGTNLMTTINTRQNFLRPNLLLETLPPDTLGRHYLSRYRLTRSYMQANWPRMRDAFETYVPHEY